MKKVYINLKFSIEWVVLTIVSLLFWGLILCLSFHKLDTMGLIIYIIFVSLFEILALVVLILNCFHKVFLLENNLIYRTIITQKTIDLNSVIEVKKINKIIYDTILQEFLHRMNT